MKAYIIDQGLYVGPFPREAVIKSFEKLVYYVDKLVDEMSLEFIVANLDIMAIFDNSWDKYYIGLYIEDMMPEEIRDIIISMLKKANLIHDDEIPKPVELEESMFTIVRDYSYEKELGSLSIKKNLKILDEEVKFYERYRDYLDRSYIGIRYNMGLSAGSVYLERFINVKYDFTAFKNMFNTLSRIINGIKRHSGVVKAPEIRRIRRDYDVVIDLINTSIYLLHYSYYFIYSMRNVIDLIESTLSAHDNLYGTLKEILSYKIPLGTNSINIPKTIFVLNEFFNHVGLFKYIDRSYIVIENTNKILEHSIIEELDKGRLRLSDIEQLLYLINKVLLDRNILIATVKYTGYTPYLYSEKRVLDELGETLDYSRKVLKSIRSYILKAPSEEIYEYLKDRRRFYNHIAYPLMEKMIKEYEWFIEKDHAELVELIAKLLTQRYSLKYLPSMIEVYGYKKTLRLKNIDKELINTYRDIFKPEYIDHINRSLLEYLLRDYSKNLPAEFIEAVVNKLYSTIVDKINDLVVSDHIDEALKKTLLAPKPLAIKIINEIIWPNLKARIDELALHSPVKAIEYIDSVLTSEELKATNRGSPAYILKRRLIGRKLGLIRK